MKLHDLSLEDLMTLGKHIDCLHDAGERLAQGGFAVNFNLQPGDPVLVVQGLFQVPECFVAADPSTQRDDDIRMARALLGPSPHERSIMRLADDIAKRRERAPEASSGVDYHRAALEDDLGERRAPMAEQPLAAALVEANEIFRGLAEPLDDFPPMPGEADFDGPMVVEAFGSFPEPVSANPVAPPPACAEAPAVEEPSAGAQNKREYPAGPPAPAAEEAPLPGTAAGLQEIAGGQVTEVAVRERPDGGGCEAQVNPPDAPVAGGAASSGQYVAHDVWTEAEHDRLITFYLDERERGAAKGAAIATTARALGRTPGAVQFRVYSTLNQRIEAEQTRRLLARATEPAPAQADISPQVVPVADQAAEGGVAAPSSAATLGDLLADDLGQHLWQLPRSPGGWNLIADRDLMQMAIEGSDMDAIGLELGKHPVEVKKRFMALRGSQGFARQDVLDRLNAFLVAPPAQAQAAE